MYNRAITRALGEEEQPGSLRDLLGNPLGGRGWPGRRKVTETWVPFLPLSVCPGSQDGTLTTFCFLRAVAMITAQGRAEALGLAPYGY